MGFWDSFSSAGWPAHTLLKVDLELYLNQTCVRFVFNTLNSNGGRCGKQDGEEINHQATLGHRDHNFRVMGSLKELSWEKCNRNLPWHEYCRSIIFVWILSVPEQSFREQVSPYYSNYSQPRCVQKLLIILGLHQIWGWDFWRALMCAMKKSARKAGKPGKGMEQHLESLRTTAGMFIVLCLLFWVCALPLPLFVFLCYLCNKIPLGI